MCRAAIRFVLVAVAVAAAFALGETSAQTPGQIPRIGYLEVENQPLWREGFRKGLAERGYEEGRNIAIDWRSGLGNVDRGRRLAEELVLLDPKLIVASSPPALLALMRFTQTIPIVMTNINDPVRLGAIASLARPGGNVTGLSSLSTGLMAKRLELLAELRPGLAYLAIIGDQNSEAGQLNFQELEEAAARSRLTTVRFAKATPDDFEAAFQAAAAVVSGGVVVMNNPSVLEHQAAILAAAQRHRVPAVYFGANFVAAGGLASYGQNIVDLHRRAAVYVDKILKGAKPGDLPAEQADRFELVLNLRVAKALGLAIPPSLLVRADEVIE